MQVISARLPHLNVRVASGTRGPRKPNSSDRIVAVMQPYTAYLWEELRAASGLSGALFGPALGQLIAQRRVDKTLDHNATFYSLP